MFIRQPRFQNIIRIPHNFLTLDAIHPNGDLEFSLVYHINQSDVVKRGVAICRITAISRVVKTRNIIFDNPWPRIDNSSVIRHILSLTANARAAAKNQENFEISVTRVDHTKVVNNELIRPLRAGVPLSSISALHKSAVSVRSIRDLNQENNVYPILQINPSPPIENISLPPIRHVYQNHLVRYGIDPTYTYDFDDETLDPEEAIHGVYNKNGNRHVKNIYASQQQLVEVFKQLTYVPQHPSTITSVNYNEDTKILTFSSKVSDQSLVKTKIILPASKVKDEHGKYKNVYLQFDLLYKNIYTIQTLQEKIDVLKHVEVFYTPKLPPVAHPSKFDTTTRGNIKVRQVDPTAKAVRLYRKNFSYAINEVDDYTFINEYPLVAESGFDNIPVDVSARNTTIFRLVPVGPHETLGSEFTNVVIKPSHPAKKITYVSLTSKIVNAGINLEIREVPSDVVAVRVVRRDDSIHETKYSIVGDDVIQVNVHDHAALYVVTDNNVKTGHVYEYVCELIYRNGTITQSGNAIVEFNPLVEHLVDTKIENLQVNFDINSLDVKFDIHTTVLETQLDTIRNLLKRQGIEEHFAADLTNERDKLEQLVAHEVHRINETTGQRENFGTVTSKSFSDLQLRAVHAVSPLKVGHRYRYEVVALLRLTETLLENFVKQTFDSNTKKPYVYKPNKFLHPITLRYGNIGTQDTIKFHYPKDQMSFGNVGNLAQVDVSFAEETTGVFEATVEEFDRTQLLVKWKINGSPGNIDHFVIMKEHLGQRKIVGKSHASFERQTFTFVFTRGTFDVGELFFLVQPVYNTYSVGTAIRTNGITLE